MSLTIYIDADACPVREETYKVAERHTVPVVVVSNSYIRIPKFQLFSAVIVSDSFKDRSRFLEALHLALERRKQR